MNVLRRRRDLVCQQAVELVTDYLDGALSKRDRARLEKHLSACPHCTEYLAQVRRTVAALGRAEAAAALTPDARDALVGLYRQWREPPF